MRKPISGKAVMLGACACIAAAALATAAYAQQQQQQQQPQQTRETPKNWSYELKDGKRVPKANRVSNPDGSWREELKQGNCVTVKERAPTGEYKESRECNPNTPG